MGDLKWRRRPFVWEKILVFELFIVLGGRLLLVGVDVLKSFFILDIHCSGNVQLLLDESFGVGCLEDMGSF